MEKWSVEMSYGVMFSATIEASSKEDAIEEAKRIIGSDVIILDKSEVTLECSEFQFQEVTFIQEDN